MVESFAGSPTIWTGEPAEEWPGARRQVGAIVSPLALVITAIGLLLAIAWLRRQPVGTLGPMLTRVVLVVGVLALLLALFSGRLHPLIAAAGGALLLLQRLFAAKQLFDRFNTARAPSGGTSSKVSTRILDMSLDHDSAEMDGTVREGRFAGRLLSQLSVDELLELLTQCHAEDAQSATVLEAYLDRVHGDGWRERMGPEPGEERSPRDSAAMSVEEAREILGVDEAASRDEIVAAHRKLMQRLHPDRGGTTYLAMKVNQAKDLLLE